MRKILTACGVAALVLGAVSTASADTKVRKRMVAAGGGALEMVEYVKGARVRVENNFGGTVMVTLQSRHDRVIGKVERSGQTILDMELENPEQISGADVTILDGLHLTRKVENGKEVALIIQVDPEYVFHSASRGRPRLLALQSEAWGAENRLRCTNPMHAVFSRCDTDLPKLRFAMDPLIPVTQGGSRRRAA